MNSKQRALLRGMANTIDPIFQIGKGGINENLIAQVNDALENRELIKLSVLQNCEYTAGEAAQELAEATCSESVQIIGSRFVLYRVSSQKPRIVLERGTVVVREPQAPTEAPRRESIQSGQYRTYRNNPFPRATGGTKPRTSRKPTKP